MTMFLNPFSTRFLGDFHYLWNAIIIKPIKLQTAQRAYQKNDIDHDDILIELFFETSFEKGEESYIEIPSFQERWS